MTDLETFTRSYIETMLWSSNDEDDEPLDLKYGQDNISEEAIYRINEDCELFWNKNHHVVSGGRAVASQYSEPELAGHDFWLTRNGHGTGFWDGDWTEPAATYLTDAAKAFGECDAYVGDDGLIYLS